VGARAGAGRELGVARGFCVGRAEEVKRVVALLALVLVFAAYAVLLGVNLDSLPGLHSDEAWFGLQARAILDGKASTIHGMNAHTGAIYPYVVAASFRAFGVSVLALRAVGVALNVVALALLVATAAIAGRGRGLVVVVLLALGSMLFTSEARIAWEVTALNPLLGALILFASALWMRSDAATSRARATLGSFALLLTLATGVYSHFIFLAFATALFVATALTALRRPTPALVQLVVAHTFSMIDVVVLTVIKVHLFHTGAATPYAAWVALAFIAVEALIVGWLVSSNRVLTTIEALFVRHAARARSVAWALVAIGGAMFVVCHGIAFFDTFANGPIMKRLYSVALPTPFVVVSFVFAASTLALYARACYLAVRRRLAVDDLHYFFLVAPVCVMAALPIHVMSTAIRYYVLPNVALVMGTWVAWLFLPKGAARVAGLAFAAYALVLDIQLFRVVCDRDHYASVTYLTFPFGTRDEESAHFLSLRAAVVHLRAEHATSFETNEPFFIRRPLDFYATIIPPLPGSQRVGVVNYDSHARGGFAYELRRESGAR
jgi:hypothetical protein